MTVANTDKSFGGLCTVLRAEENFIVLEIFGELDMASAPGLRARLAEAMAMRIPPRVVIDAQELTFCDSTGLSILAAALQATEAVGGRLALTGAHGSFARVLTITGLNALFNTYPTFREACEHVREDN